MRFGLKLVPALPLCLAILVASHGLLGALATGHMLSGHDAGLYGYFLRGIHENIVHGNLIQVWNQFGQCGFGEPNLEFRPPLQSYLAELFFLLTGRVIASLNLASLALLVLAVAGMHRLARRLGTMLGFSGPAETWFACLAAVAYACSPFHLRDIYARSAFSEASCFAVFPWLALAFLRLATRPTARSFALAAMAYAALATSHAAIHLVTLPFLAGAALYFHREIKNRALFAGAVAMGFAASAFHWLPSMAEKSAIKALLFASGPDSYPGKFARLGQLLHTPVEQGLYSVGVFAWIGMAWALACWSLPPVPRRQGACAHDDPAGAVLGFGEDKRGLRRLTLALLASCAACAYLMHRTSALWWEAFPWLQFLSYPTRILTIFTFFAALLGALAAARVFKAQWHWWAAACLLLALGIPESLPKYMNISESAFTGEKLVESGWGFVIYYSSPSTLGAYPHAVPARLGDFLEGGGELGCARKSPTLILCDARARESSVLRLSVLDYPGWTFSIDGKRAPASATGRDPIDGTLFVRVPAGDHQVRLELLDTPARAAGKAISVVAWLVLLALLF